MKDRTRKPNRQSDPDYGNLRGWPAGRSPGAGWPGLLAAVLLAPSLSAQRVEGPAADPFEKTLAECRSLASSDGRPILLYFPSARPAEIPSALRETKSVRKAARDLHLARARAEEVKDLLGRFGVSRVPALVLLDRQGGAVDRWENPLPPAVWIQVGRGIRRLRQAEGEALRAAAEAEAALGGGDHAAALAAVARIRARARAGYPEMEVAARVEGEVLDRSAVELRKALGTEGLVSDRKLAETLRGIRERFPHPLVSSRIDRELERIRTRPIAGKARPPDEIPPGGGRGGTG